MVIINTIETYSDKNKQQITKNNKTYYVCNCCGRLSFRKIKSHNKVWCYKHYNQFKKFGKVLDNNPRTILDKNEITIDKNIAYIKLYNHKCEEIAIAIIDSNKVDLVKNTKWKLSSSGYVMNCPKFKSSNIHLSRRCLGVDTFVDHINHNPLDNRVSNLRVITKSQNQMNVNYKGISRLKNGKYCSYIKINQKMINLGTYIDIEEAYFARWYAEVLLFKEFRYPKEKPFILESREKDIKEYVDKKVQRL